MDIFSLNDFIKVETLQNLLTTGTVLSYIMLTNKMRSFQKINTVTTGISDCHKMIVTCLNAHLKKHLPKKIS